MKRILAITIAVTFMVAMANADPIIGSPTGLASPAAIITFDELGNLEAQPVGNQFAALGAIFDGFVWSGQDLGQVGSTGFAGGFLTNGVYNSSSQTMIEFTSVMSAAAFAAVDQGGQYLIESLLSGAVVESFTTFIGFNPGSGFMGFQNSAFDALRITPLSGSAIGIDTLQMNPAVPEPGSMFLLGSGLLGLARTIRKKRA